MINKITIVFAGIILAGVFLNLYFAILAFFTAFLLGVESEMAFTIQYWLCFAAGGATSFFLMRKAWPKPRQKEDVAQQVSS